MSVTKPNKELDQRGRGEARKRQLETIINYYFICVNYSSIKIISSCPSP